MSKSEIVSWDDEDHLDDDEIGITYLTPEQVAARDHAEAMSDEELDEAMARSFSPEQLLLIAQGRTEEVLRSLSVEQEALTVSKGWRLYQQKEGGFADES